MVILQAVVCADFELKCIVLGGSNIFACTLNYFPQLKLQTAKWVLS